MGSANGRTMAKRFFLCLWLLSGLFFINGDRSKAQEDTSRILVNVVLVQLNVAVTDRKGNYVNGLRPEDFSITEDKIPQRVASFEAGGEPVRKLIDSPASNTPPPPAAVTPSETGSQDASDPSKAPELRLAGANNSK